MSAIINLVLRNPLIVLIAGTAVGGLVFIYWLWEKYRPETHVLLIGDEERRLDTVYINRETPTTLSSYDRKQPRRFFKLFAGYIESRRGKRILNYIGKRGTAYTWRIAAYPAKEFRIGSLWDAINLVWDKALIDKIPEAAQAQLKTSDVYVTVQIAGGLTPEGYKPITEETIISEGDRIMAEEFAKASKTANKPNIMFVLLALGSGGLLTVFILGLLNWLKIGG